MSDSDFNFAFGTAIFIVLWIALMGYYTTGQIQESEIAQYQEQGGVLGSLTMFTDFLNPFSDNFDSDFAMINILVFTCLSFGLLLVALRFIRGQ